MRNDARPHQQKQIYKISLKFFLSNFFPFRDVMNFMNEKKNSASYCTY